MAKIAVELEQALSERARHGAPASLATRLLARGDGWSVEDVVCTSGPRDRVFEERHSIFRIAVVAAGSFQCRAGLGRELMTPGSLLLGSPGQHFECGHHHGAGDRCISFGFSTEIFEALQAPRFACLRLPPVAGSAPLVARACAGLASGRGAAEWEDLGLQLAARAAELAAEDGRHHADPPPSAIARVNRVVRRIDHDPSASLPLRDLAREARLSAFHFLRIFERLTGLTPHQYLRRARLRAAAVRLAAGREKVLDVALDCGFGDAANFNHAFRAEFGVNPRAWRVRNAISALR